MELPSPGYIIRNKYELIEIIGQGGMGAVFRGRHLIWKEDRAIKVMLHTRSDEPMTRSFLAEAWVMRQLKHANIIQVEDVDYDDEGRLFIAMELVDGESLNSRLQRFGMLSERDAFWIAIQACQALEEAHSHGIIHRDIKPHNILLSKGQLHETVKLIDFGLAKVRRYVDSGQTTTLLLNGLTPAYASPEQILASLGMPGPELDERSDLYSLGIVLYQMLSGALPFDPGSLGQRLHISPKPLDQMRPNISTSLIKVVMKALARDPKLRYSSAHEMHTALTTTIVGEIQHAAYGESADKILGRTESILSTTPLPEPETIEIGLLRQPDGGLAMKKTDSGMAFLFFTSRHFAIDYLQCFGELKHARPIGITLTNLVSLLTKNPKPSVVGATFNPCPRCGVFTKFSAADAADTDKLRKMWALSIATKQILVERDLPKATNEVDLLKQRVLLENIRDHHDPGVPQVHYELAVNALKLEDRRLFEQARNALDQFGTDWINRLATFERTTKPTPALEKKNSPDGNTALETR